MESNHSSERSQPPAAGPWMIKAIGYWGTGAHSRLEIQDVRIINIGLPPADDDDLDGTFIRGQAFVPEMYEDIEPTEGLDVPLGNNQRLIHTTEGMELVRDDDAS